MLDDGLASSMCASQVIATVRQTFRDTGEDDMTATGWSMAIVASAAAFLPMVAYKAQPPACFRDLYLPWVVLPFVLLSLLAAGLQPLTSLSDRVKMVSAVAFTAGIQFMVTIPCISRVGESEWVLRLAPLLLVGGWAAGLALLASAAGLFTRSGGPEWITRCVAGAGLLLCGLALLSGATALYLGIVSPNPGAVEAVPLESQRGRVLAVGLALASIGLVANVAQRLRGAASERAQ